jgi:hypothetical protein
VQLPGEAPEETLEREAIKAGEAQPTYLVPLDKPQEAKTHLIEMDRLYPAPRLDHWQHGRKRH